MQSQQQLRKRWSKEASKDQPLKAQQVMPSVNYGTFKKEDVEELFPNIDDAL